MKIKPRLAKVHSRANADKYIQLGWSVCREFRALDDDEPYEYLLEWLQEGEPISPMQRTDEIYSYWTSGQALSAGRIVYERIQNRHRPRWAIGVLEQCLSLVPSITELEALRILAREPTRWKEAHAAFWAIRQRLTLPFEAAKETNTLYSWLLHLSENTAKVIYNASGEPAPFDYNAGWWVVECARGVVDIAAEPGLEESVWAAIASIDII